MRTRTLAQVLLLLAASGLVAKAADTAAAPAPAAPPPLQKGDRIVFLGDSITQGGGGPKGYITLVRGALDAAVPNLAVETVNAGISGNKVPDLQRRLDKDVLDKKPTIVFIYIGINDVWHWKKQSDGTLAGGTPKDRFEAGLKEIIGKIRSAGARVILCTPSVIGEKPDGTNERDAMLDEYAAVSRRVAAETGVQLLDLRQAFLDFLKAHNPEGQAKGVLTGDGVHLNPEGNKLVARAMLGALGVPADSLDQ